MSLTHHIELEGMSEARGLLRGLLARSADPTPFADAVGQTLVESSVNRLAVTNKSPDGTPWPNSARARAKGGPTQYDRGSGGLAGSITHEVAPGGLSVAVGSNKPYAAMRQFGGTIRPKKPGGFLVFEVYEDDGTKALIFARQVTQPGRPYLGVSSDDADDIAGLALEYFNIAVGGGTVH